MDNPTLSTVASAEYRAWCRGFSVQAMGPEGCSLTPPALDPSIPMVFLPVCAVRGNPAHDPTSAGQTGPQLSAPRDRLAFCSSQVLRRVSQSLPQSPGGHRLGLSGSIQFSNTPQSPLLPQPQAGCRRYTVRVVCDLESLRMQQGTEVNSKDATAPPGSVSRL